MATGCGTKEEEDNTTPRESTSSKASALTSPVEEAAANPSGQIDGGNMGGIFEAYADFDLATLDGMPAGVGLDPFGAPDLGQCASGDALAGSVDLTCLTGGEVTGTVVFEIAVDGANAWVYHQLNDVCIPADDLCMDGEGAVEVKSTSTGASTIVAGNLTLTEGGQTDELRYGVTQSVDANGITNQVVLWHNGDSYVVTTSAGAGGVSYAVEGANGSWSCSLEGSIDALSGSCVNGDESIDF